MTSTTNDSAQPERAGAGRRRRLVAVAAAGSVVLAGAILALQLAHANNGTNSDSALAREPAPLPPGPSAVDGRGSGAATARVTLDEMVATADLVFVGTVQEIGGIETIDGNSPLPFLAHRVRYEIRRLLRGENVAQTDITDPLISEAAFPAEVGRAYLVFAEWRELGDARVRRLVPSGYAQGIYAMDGEGQAANEANGSVSIETIAEKLR